MNTQQYLSRIKLGDRQLSANAAYLALLQRSHLLSVPFENLDIHWKRPITLDVGRFYEKIVNERRGGFCYELNGLFNELLQSLGFTTRLISARVAKGGVPGPEYDHAAIIVTIDGEEYLADVGFGDFTAEPLRFVVDEVQNDPNGAFIIRRFDEEYLEVAKRDADGWTGEYIFKDIARDLSEFVKMSDFQQFSPDSHFTKGRLCSIMTANGRRTLSDGKYIVTDGEKRVETLIDSPADFSTALEREFGIGQDG